MLFVVVVELSYCVIFIVILSHRIVSLYVSYIVMYISISLYYILVIVLFSYDQVIVLLRNQSLYYYY